MEIAFTIGNTKAYDQSLNDQPETCYKTGKCDGYDGGLIWKTHDEAKLFLQSNIFLNIVWNDGKSRDPKHFSVYKVLLVNGWDQSVSLPDENGVNHLLVDSRFMK